MLQVSRHALTTYRRHHTAAGGAVQCRQQQQSLTRLMVRGPTPSNFLMADTSSAVVIFVGNSSSA
jgi:hypothetical protein